MNQDNQRWLAKQLPELLAEKVINAETVDRLSKYFALDDVQQSESGLSRMTIILAAIGGLLIGGGIIMLFAHNWDSLSRPIRTFLAIAPLIVSQIFALMALYPKQRGAAWREASAAPTKHMRVDSLIWFRSGSAGGISIRASKAFTKRSMTLGCLRLRLSRRGLCCTRGTSTAQSIMASTKKSCRVRAPRPLTDKTSASSPVTAQ